MARDNPNDPSIAPAKSQGAEYPEVDERESYDTDSPEAAQRREQVAKLLARRAKAKASTAER